MHVCVVLLPVRAHVADIAGQIVEGEVCVAIECFRHHILHVVDGRNRLVDHVVFLLALSRVSDAVFVRLVVEGDACLVTERLRFHVLHVVDGRNRLVAHVVFLLVRLHVGARSRHRHRVSLQTCR